MTVRFYEETGSRSATIKRLGVKETSTCDVKFRCTGLADDAQVHAYAAQFFNTYRIRVLSGITMLVVSYDVSHLGGDTWEVIATYESQGQDDPERATSMKRSRSFDTVGGTAHVTVGSKETRFGAGAPDMKCAIEVSGEDVRGVDIVVPALQWSEQYDVPSGIVSLSYIKTVASITGKVNDAGFRGFDADEVLFIGCSGAQQWDDEKGDGPWSLTYKFVASQNVTGLTIGPITNVSKKGHEYLWTVFENTVDASYAVKRPKFAYATEVYKRAAFSSLGIG